jgi:hypothetical protein
MPTLCNLQGVEVVQDADGRVHFTADADIDADGTNGQSKDNSEKRMFAYAPGDNGLDALRNAGYPDGSYRDILVCGSNSEPMVFNGGYYSKTTYFDKTKNWDDPDRYLDSYSIPYIVVEGFIRRRAKGVVLGCKAKVTNTRNGKSVGSIVGDMGPLMKIGELSMAAARAIGINADPKRGGESDHIIQYELWPGQAAVINDKTYDLIPSVAG